MLSVQLISLLAMNFQTVNTTKYIKGNLMLCLNIISQPSFIFLLHIFVLQGT